jgi:hypothetical protein
MKKSDFATNFCTTNVTIGHFWPILFFIDEQFRRIYCRFTSGFFKDSDFLKR